MGHEKNRECQRFMGIGLWGLLGRDFDMSDNEE